MLIAAVLPVMPASALHSNLVGISDTEVINWQASYAPNVDGTNGAVSVTANGGTGTITITNNAPTSGANSIALNDVDILFNTGTTSNWLFSSALSTSGVVGGIKGTSEVTIKLLPAGAHATFTYTIGSITSPLTMSALYTNNKVTDATTSFTDVTLTATANGVAITPTITVTSANAGSATPDWTFSNIDAGHVVASSGNSVLTWTPGAISSGSSAQTTFRATVADTAALDNGVDEMALFNLATSSATYTISSSTQSSAGVGVNSIYATTSEVSSNLDKKLVNGQWQFTPGVSIPVTGTDITYELDAVSIWAVDGGALGTQIYPTPASSGPMIIDGTHVNNGETFPVTFTNPSGWTGAGNEIMKFSYAGVPVGFEKPVVKINDDPAHAQFVRSYTEQQGTVTLLKQIYVISGYEVQVVKTITPGASAGQYHVSIVATNLGTKNTPPHVYIYDIVPTGFAPTFTGAILPVNQANPTPVSGTVTGDAYYWDLGQLSKNGVNPYQKTVTYDVAGSGTYTTADLYVVGVDPAQSLNLLTMPNLQNVASMTNSNFEPLAALGAFGLLAIGMFGVARRKF